MMRETGCDGVVIGRGCLGRPWLFRDLVEALNGRPVPPPPTLGEVCDVMAQHARLLVPHMTEPIAMRDFRKHTSWYFTGYPVGGEVRRQFSGVSTLTRARRPDRHARPDDDHRRGRCSASAAATPTARSASCCPHGYLDHLDDEVVPDDSDVMALSGG